MNVPALPIFGIDIVAFSISLATAFALFLAVSLTLNIEAGYTGIPNFGKVMFVAGGAALAGSVSGRLATLILAINTNGDYNTHIAQIITKINTGLSNNPILSIELLLTGVALAAGIGGGLGLLASYPAIRLREDYLGMLLLASAQLFQIFLGGYQPFIGGTQGIEVPDVFQWAEIGTGVRDVAVLGVLAIFVVLVYIYAERMARSPLGRTLRAVRDNEHAARALGKNDVAIRRNVIVIASAICGMAGALITFWVSSVGPDTWTRVTWTFWPWVIVILGGAANNAGVALGALVFTFIMEIIGQVKFSLQSYIPFDVNWLYYLVFAAMLLVTLALRPGGILPEKSSTTLPRYSVAKIMQPWPVSGWDKVQPVSRPASAESTVKPQSDSHHDSG